MSFPRNVPTATIELDKPRKIALTLDALNRLEETTGQSLMLLELDPSHIVKQLHLWVWSGLDDADREEVSAAEIRQMIHIGNLKAVLDAVTSLIVVSLPEVSEGKPIPVPPKARRAVAGKS